jgi:hypothetical protein
MLGSYQQQHGNSTNGSTSARCSRCCSQDGGVSAMLMAAATTGARGRHGNGGRTLSIEGGNKSLSPGCRRHTGSDMRVGPLRLPLRDLLRLSAPSSDPSGAAVAGTITTVSVSMEDLALELSRPCSCDSGGGDGRSNLLAWWWITQFLTHTLPRAFVNLRSLALCGSRAAESSSLSAKVGGINAALAATIAGLGRLQELVLTRFPLVVGAAASEDEDNRITSESDGRQLCLLLQALRHHPTLTTVKLFECTDATHVDGIVDALSTVSQLECLDICCCSSSSSSSSLPSTSAPSRSGEKGQVESGIGPKNTIGVSNNLKGTTLLPRTLKKMITSCPNLSDLSLWHCHLSDVHLDALASTLLVVEVAGACSINHTNKDSNDSGGLQFVSFRSNPSISAMAWNHFYKTVLPHQYTLTAIANDHAMFLSSSHLHPALPYYELDFPTGNAAAMAELYLGLNQLGRGSVFQIQEGPSTAQQQCDADSYDDVVVEFLEQISDSPSAIFAMLSSKPSLVLRHQNL